ncbi:MAG: alpha/beta fold hydrolase, partial [Planctomycetes bacterium]|nr:alpha/beta fold hydrolase [Planctomycetota bacterium]
MVDPKAKSIDLKSESNREFFLIHGYTGSPMDFGGLGEYLHKRFDANVRVVRLKGHGETIEELDHYEYQDFLEQIEEELEKDLDRGRIIVLGGVSFGAQMALALAARYPVRGVFNVSIPYTLKFPFNLLGMVNQYGFGILAHYKKYWKKQVHPQEVPLRKNSFHYTQMHINGYAITKIGNKILRKTLGGIFSPCLSIHTHHDPVSHLRGLKRVEKRICAKIKKSVVFESEVHNLFFSEERGRLGDLIGDFFAEHKVFERAFQSEPVAAIVPSYNEAERIGDVLKALSATKLLQEIVVVDDGSQDNTAEVVQGFPKVTYLRNETNRGKSYSMERGVQATRSGVIFFCDADLHDLTPEIVEQIIRPVMQDEIGMYIGIRHNTMQRIFTPFAINSGERALRRETWEQLPSYYKHRYRVEVGLNNFVRHQGKGVGYRSFNYYQTLKETKYGIVKGTLLRWWMNFDVSMA